MRWLYAVVPSGRINQYNADKRYRSGALKRKRKNERQRREKEALSKLKTTAWCTCASWEISRKLLEPIWFHVQSSPSVDYRLFCQKPWRRQQKQRLHKIGLQLLLILTLLILLAGVKLMRMCVLTGRGKVHWHNVGLRLDVRYSHI